MRIEDKAPIGAIKLFEKTGSQFWKAGVS